MDKITHLDFLLISKVMRYRGRFLDRLFRVVSFTGDGYFYPVILVLMMFFGNAQGISPLALTLATAFAIELSLYRLIKRNVKRLRPFAGPLQIINHVVPSDEFSFPSGHTAAAFLMVVFLNASFPSLLPVFMLWALSVGFSRVYLGVHYPSDILAGMVLGLFSAITAIQIIPGF